MKVAVQVCDDVFARDVWGQLNDNYSDSAIVKEIIRKAPKIDDSMVFCKFRDEVKKCDELFTQSITEEGLCYSFNKLNNNEVLSDE